jgi:uncharacterized protein involved in propanediol utilization
MTKISRGSAFGHAGEFLQGAVENNGTLRRILITIPAPELRSNATFTASEENGLTVTPRWKQKSLTAFHLSWLLFSAMAPCGMLEIQSEIPVSGGMGSSTADCVAAIRAAAAYWNRELRPDQIATLAHQAECFSDATMYEDRLVVFQHCEGKLHEYLDGDIPNFQLLVVEPRSDFRIDTDALTRPDYSAAEICQFSECLSRFRHACAVNDVHEIARIATISARINQRYHPKARMDEVVRIATENDALGIAVAHSGIIQILLFPPAPLGEQVLRKVSIELEEIGMKSSRVLSTRREPKTMKLLR